MKDILRQNYTYRKAHRPQAFIKDQQGMSNMVELLVGIGILLLIVAVVIGAVTQIQKNQVLDTFAEQMAMCAGTYGKCQGTEISARYEQLAASTGLRPTMKITGDSYFSAAAKTVQYGGAITVKLTLDSRLIGYGSVSVPLRLEAKKLTQSMQYWK